MPYLELRDGVPLYYEDYGSGQDLQTLVLIPGWTLTTRFWQRQIDDLARDYRIVTLDLRGAGNSGKTPDGHSLAGYADDLEELLGHLDVTAAVIVGYAMGVSIAVHHLVAHGLERAAGLVWVDHSPRFYRTPDWDYALFGDLTPQQFDTTIRGLWHDRPAGARDLLEVMFQDPESWMYDEVMKTPTEVAAAMLGAVAATDLRPLLHALRLPTLLVNGRRSVVPYEVGRWLAGQLPDARAVVLEAGHGPFWDDAASFNEALRVFSASLADSPAP